MMVGARGFEPPTPRSRTEARSPQSRNEFGPSSHQHTGSIQRSRAIRPSTAWLLGFMPANRREVEHAVTSIRADEISHRSSTRGRSPARHARRVSERPSAFVRRRSSRPSARPARSHGVRADNRANSVLTETVGGLTVHTASPSSPPWSHHQTAHRTRHEKPRKVG